MICARFESEQQREKKFWKDWRTRSSTSPWPGESTNERNRPPMTPAELLPLLQRRPFVPFQLLLSTGATYDIRHPELVMVGRGTVIVGIPINPQTPIYEQWEIVNLDHVTCLPLPDLTVGKGATS